MGCLAYAQPLPISPRLPRTQTVTSGTLAIYVPLSSSFASLAWAGTVSKPRQKNWKQQKQASNFSTLAYVRRTNVTTPGLDATQITFAQCAGTTQNSFFDTPTPGSPVASLFSAACLAHGFCFRTIAQSYQVVSHARSNPPRDSRN